MTRFALCIAVLLSGCGAATPPARTAGLAAAACPAGQAAFERTVYPLVRTHCALCHDGTGRGPASGPAFAVADPQQSRQRVRARVEFSNIPGSVFVVTGGNHHCLSHGGPPDCGASQAEVLAAVNSWWTQGENRCDALGALVTGQLPLPATLPTKTQDFQTLRWDLGQLDPTLVGMLFEIQAQHFAVPSTSTRGAYRFREPRIATADKPIFVEGIRLAINGAYNQRDSVYTTVRQTVMPQALPADPQTPLPSPALSPFPLILLQDKADGDTVQVGFASLRPTRPVTCAALDEFLPIFDVLQARDCYTCHGGGPANEPGVTFARQRLAMTGTPAELCAQALQRLDRRDPQQSVYLSYPLRGSNGHPQAIPRAEEIEPLWSSWSAAEIARQQDQETASPRL